MENDERARWLQATVALAKKAGRSILYYRGLSRDQLNVSRKIDDTLLTTADLSAHKIIQVGLQRLTPDIPILSEEDLIPGYDIRCQWSRYWLVDPLDGTRGFVEQRDEFTVNIALIEYGQPVLGVVYSPVQHLCYFASHGQGAYKQILDRDPKCIQTIDMNWQSFRVLLGHYLHSPRLLELFATVPACQIIRLNSSLKFCWIAEGRGDIYPRFGQTSEWDTAAAQCILEQAGGSLVDFSTKSLQYNTKESLINPAFVALGDPAQKARIIELINLRLAMRHNGDISGDS